MKFLTTLTGYTALAHKTYIQVYYLDDGDFFLWICKCDKLHNLTCKFFSLKTFPSFYLMLTEISNWRLVPWNLKLIDKACHKSTLKLGVQLKQVHAAQYLQNLQQSSRSDDLPFWQLCAIHIYSYPKTVQWNWQYI